MATSKSNELLELPIFPLTITTMSVNAKGTGKGTGVEPLRRTCIVDVIRKYKPDILLFQEFKWMGIEGSVWEDTPIPDRYVYTGNKEASIIYDTERFCLEELAQTKLQRPLDELKRKGKVSQDFTPLTRSTIRLLEPNGSLTSSETFKILVVSWHGVNNGTGMNNEKKKKQFQHLQVYLKELSKNENAAVIVGGDFNINIDLIRDIVSPDFILSRYSASKRREGKVIDYFIVSHELSFENVKYIELSKLSELMISVQNLVLNHDPVLAIVIKKESMDGSGYDQSDNFANKDALESNMSVAELDTGLSKLNLDSYSLPIICYSNDEYLSNFTSGWVK